MSLVTQQLAGDVLGWWHLEDVAQLLHLGVPRGSVLPSHKHQLLCALTCFGVFSPPLLTAGAIPQVLEAGQEILPLPTS